MLIYQLVEELQKSKIKFALVGGYALALHGIVRATIDNSQENEARICTPSRFSRCSKY